MKFANDAFKDPGLKQAFSLARGAFCEKLATHEFPSNEGSNDEGILTHWKKTSDPCSLRAIHEVGDTVAKLSTQDKDTLRPRQAITVANATLALGTRLRGGDEKVDSLELCLTASVQGDLYHLYFPFTSANTYH